MRICVWEVKLSQTIGSSSWKMTAIVLRIKGHQVSNVAISCNRALQPMQIPFLVRWNLSYTFQMFKSMITTRLGCYLFLAVLTTLIQHWWGCSKTDHNADSHWRSFNESLCCDDKQLKLAVYHHTWATVGLGWSQPHCCSLLYCGPLCEQGMPKGIEQLINWNDKDISFAKNIILRKTAKLLQKNSYSQMECRYCSIVNNSNCYKGNIFKTSLSL